MIDSFRLSVSARHQLVALKKKTGIEHYNILCRHALCISLANPSVPPKEAEGHATGIEMDWRIFTGGHEVLYLNLLATRLTTENHRVTPEAMRQALVHHVHRGLSYMSGKREDDLLAELAVAISRS